MLIVCLALIPTMLYSWLLWRLDRYEHEPLKLLFVTFCWGAVPALILAALVEVGVGSLIGLGEGLDATLLAPLIEEPLKALALLGVFFFVRREFHGVLDGIIYGAMVGFGFAMTENIAYFLDSGTDLAVIWVLRAILFGFNHAFFTSIVGIGLGLVRYDRRRWLGYVVFPASLAFAILLHAIHNASVQAGVAGLCLSWIINSGGVLTVLVVAILAQRRERYWIETQLTSEVGTAVIAPADLQAVSTPALRFRLEVRTFFRHGWLPYRHRRRFYQLLVELAYTKHRLSEGDRYCCQEDVDKLRDAVVAERALAPEV